MTITEVFNSISRSQNNSCRYLKCYYDWLVLLCMVCSCEASQWILAKKLNTFKQHCVTVLDKTDRKSHEIERAHHQEPLSETN